MIVSAIVASASAWLLGALGVGALWPRERPPAGDVLLIVSLGLGVGLGLTSALFFGASLVSARPVVVSAALELLIATGFAVCLWRRRRSFAATGETGRGGARSGGGRAHDAGFVSVPRTAANDFWLRVIMGSVFAQACIICLVVAVRAYLAEPYSNSDGWTIWNMHARFIYRGGGNWAALLQAPQVTWTHPDYPLLVPATVARGWAWAGQDAPFVSATISTLFAVATVGVLVAAVARLRSRVVAFAGGLVLLGTPFFVTFASNQHADIPLGFYILGTLVLMSFTGEEPRARGLAALAGAVAGLAAWTKNEGWLFVVVAGCAWVIRPAVHGSWRTVGGFAGGLAVALLPVIYFKIMLAPANDIVSSEPWGRLHDLLEGARHQLIISSIWRDIQRFGEWSIAPFVAMVLPLLGGGWRRLKRAEWLAAGVLMLMLVGFYGVYLLTHWELASHIDSSLVRLLLQLWPGAVFFWCLAVTYDPPVAEIAAGGPVIRRWRPLALVLLANAGAGGVVLAALDRQAASNQLATAWIEGEVRLLLGEGWFGRETRGNEVWAWSRGQSTLLLRSDARRSTTVALRFEIRSLGPRTVTARVGERVVWSAAVGDEIVSATIAGIVLEPGITAIEFETDVPGMLESRDPGARALTYALYNPEVKQ